MKYETDPGYQWVDPHAFFLKTKWTPGLAHPDHPHIQSSTNQDEWTPAAGYQWGPGADSSSPPATDYSDKPLSDDLTVHWQPGATRPDYAHVHAVEREGYWTADKGYKFLSDSNLAVQWTPGLPDPDRQHYVSADLEGQWEPAPGYEERTGWFGLKYAAWTPGMANRSQPCMVSTTEEGSWRPVDGFHVQRLGDGRLEIVGDTTQPDWGRVIAGGIVALAGFSASQPRQNDGLFTSAVARPLAGEVGKAGLTEAAKAFGGTNSGACAGVILDQTWAMSN